MGGSRVALSFSVRWLCSPDATDPDPDLATQSPFLSPMSPESFGIHHDGFSIPSYISTYCPLAPGAVFFRLEASIPPALARSLVPPLVHLLDGTSWCEGEHNGKHGSLPADNYRGLGHSDPRSYHGAGASAALGARF
jgi:hypothetical protein